MEFTLINLIMVNMEYTLIVIMCVCALIMINIVSTFTVIMSMCTNVGQYGKHIHCNYDHVL